MIDTLKTIGANIKRIRKAQGLSQQALSKKAKLDYRYIGFVEQARVNPSIKTLEKITGALEICLCDLCPPPGDRARPKPRARTEREVVRDRIMRNLNKATIHNLKIVDNFIRIIRAK